MVRTVACRILTEQPLSALATSPMLPPNWVELLMVKGGDKIATIQESAAGKLSVVELV